MRLNVAVTALFALIVTEQPPVPTHAPLQPAKSVPLFDVGERETTVPLSKVAEQVGGQLMPAGLLLVVPVPLPAAPTESIKV
jgi:hypothetical protein